MSSTEIIKEGWMTKQGGFVKSWHKRYFVLQQGTLTYSAQPHSEEKGKITLSECRCIQLAPECKKQPAFSILKDQRTYYFICDSAAECTCWVDLLKRVASGEEDAPITSMDDFVIEANISQRSQTLIQFVFRKHNSQKMVLKRYKRSDVQRPDKLEATLDQKKFQIRHANSFVCQVRAIIQNDDEIIIVYNNGCVGGGCLFGQLKEELKFPESRVQLYAAEMIMALSYLHSNGIIYGTLDNESILVQHNGHVIVTEPGLKSMLPKKAELSPYTTPEDLQNLPITEKTDIYSLGVLIYQMITGMTPFFDPDPETMKKFLLNEPIRYPHHVSPEAKSLINSMMNRDPSKRPSLKEIQNNAFFSGLDWNAVLMKTTTPQWQVISTIDSAFSTLRELSFAT